MMENGAEWPLELTQGRAASLSKDETNQTDPLAYRMLLIHSIVYRKWATVRLKHMKQWIQTWSHGAIFAGGENGGADEGWWTTSLEFEEHMINGNSFAGGSADIYKCFDQLSRPVLYHIAGVAGMPVGVLNAHRQ